MTYDNTIKVLERIGTEIREKYKDVLIKNRKISSGRLLDSIDYKVDYSNGNVKLIFIAEDYYIDVENGRKPGGKMPPINKIKEWLRFKGLIDRSAYVISRSIQKRGIAPTKQLIEARSVNNYSKDIEEALRLDIKQIINKRYDNIR